MGVEQFTPWGSAQPLALPQQMTARIRDAIDAGQEVAVLAVVVVKNERGNWVYNCANSQMMTEVGLMACHELQKHILRDNT